MNSRQKYLIASGLLIAALAVALWKAHAPLLTAAAQWLDVGVRPQPADYVMILNGGENERPFAVAALMKAKFARHALIAECAPTPAVEDHLIPPYHELNRSVLVKRGVPASEITILPAQAKTTFDEAKALAVFLADKPDVRVLLVTNDYHTRRSRWVFAHVLGHRMRQLSVVSVPSEECPANCWWQTTLGVMFVSSEYLKLLFYVVYYDQLNALLVWFAALALLAVVVFLARDSLSRRQTNQPLPETPPHV